MTLRSRKKRKGVKVKGKISLWRGYAVRLDASRELFRAQPAARQAAQPGEAVVEVRTGSQLWSVRALRETRAKAPLPDASDPTGSFAALTAEGPLGFRTEPPSVLVSLMKLCEQRLTPLAEARRTA